MHYDTLLFGLFGGLIFLSRGKAVTKAQAVTGAISSALLAGVFAPLVSGLLYSLHGGLTGVDSDTMRRASSMLIGGGWQVALPVAFEALKGVIKGWAPKDPQP